MSLVEKNAADQIAAGASSESEVWASALIDAPDWEPVFSPLAPAHLALGLETVYEAYLVHYGRPRRRARVSRAGAWWRRGGARARPAGAAGHGGALPRRPRALPSPPAGRTLGRRGGARAPAVAHGARRSSLSHYTRLLPQSCG